MSLSLTKTIIFLLYVGPNLPKPLGQHAMVTGDTELVVIGGTKPPVQTSMYHFSCQNRNCKWQKMDQELEAARTNVVAMIVPDGLVDCN